MKMFYNCEYIEKHWIAQWWIACYKDSIKRKSSEQRIIQHHLSIKYTFVVVHSPSRVRLFATPWTAARQAPLSFTVSRSLRKLMSIEPVMLSNHLILCCPFSSCSQSFPASGSLPMSQLFSWGGQSIAVSALASVLPMNTQDQSPLEWTGWISLQSKGLSKIFSNTAVRKHQFFSVKPSLWANSHICTWLLEKS